MCILLSINIAIDGADVLRSLGPSLSRPVALVGLSVFKYAKT